MTATAPGNLNVMKILLWSSILMGLANVTAMSQDPIGYLNDAESRSERAKQQVLQQLKKSLANSAKEKTILIWIAFLESDFLGIYKISPKDLSITSNEISTSRNATGGRICLSIAFGEQNILSDELKSSLGAPPVNDIANGPVYSWVINILFDERTETVVEWSMNRQLNKKTEGKK